MTQDAEYEGTDAKDPIDAQKLDVFLRNLAEFLAVASRDDLFILLGTWLMLQPMEPERKRMFRSEVTPFIDTAFLDNALSAYETDISSATRLRIFLRRCKRYVIGRLTPRHRTENIRQTLVNCLFQADNDDVIILTGMMCICVLKPPDQRLALVSEYTEKYSEPLIAAEEPVTYLAEDKRGLKRTPIDDAHIDAFYLNVIEFLAVAEGCDLALMLVGCTMTRRLKPEQKRLLHEDVEPFLMKAYSQDLFAAYEVRGSGTARLRGLFHRCKEWIRRFTRRDSEATRRIVAEHLCRLEDDDFRILIGMMSMCLLKTPAEKDDLTRRYSAWLRELDSLPATAPSACD